MPFIRTLGILQGREQLFSNFILCQNQQFRLYSSKSKISRSSSSSSASPSSVNLNLEKIDYRSTIAPWIPVGQFNKGLLSHLSTGDLYRSLLVLHLCSYDFIIDRNVQVIRQVYIYQGTTQKNDFS